MMVLIIIVQTLVLITATTLMLLAGRGVVQVFPVAGTGMFIASRTTLARRAPAGTITGLAS
jgi:hypothetical protein